MYMRTYHRAGGLTTSHEHRRELRRDALARRAFRSPGGGRPTSASGGIAAPSHHHRSATANRLSGNRRRTARRRRFSRIPRGMACRSPRFRRRRDGAAIGDCGLSRRRNGGDRGRYGHVPSPGGVPARTRSGENRSHPPGVASGCRLGGPPMPCRRKRGGGARRISPTERRRTAKVSIGRRARRRTGADPATGGGTGRSLLGCRSLPSGTAALAAAGRHGIRGSATADSSAGRPGNDSRTQRGDPRP